MTKTIAESNDMRATFMPKPFSNLTGNGCHSHISIWDKTGKKNLFLSKTDDLGLSKLAYQFLGGIMEHAVSMCAIFNPTVNSYKRIDAPRTTSGATWSPSSITYTGNNRTHMIRVPDDGRFELRLMDGATNPYLSQAVIIAAGLEGVKNKRDPGKPSFIDMYKEGHKLRSAKTLPSNLLDALRLLEKNKTLKEELGADLIDAYVKLKMLEWREYTNHLSQWERQATLDC